MPVVLALGLGCHSTTSLTGTPDGAADAPAGDAVTTSEGGPPPLPGLLAITVAPADRVVELADGATQVVEYAATGSFADGHSADITASVTWGVDNAEPGDIDAAGRYTANGDRGGAVQVSAANGGVRGVTSLTVIVHHTIPAGNVPATAFAAAKPRDTTTTARLPTVVYPTHETRFPRNLYRVLFQWQKGGGALFHLRFASALGTLDVYTDGSACPAPAGLDKCVKTGGACWQPDETQWGWVAGTNAGGSVELTVEEVATEGEATVFAAAPITLRFSKSRVEGAIFYWSTTAAGVRRATVSDARPEDFFAPATVYYPDGKTVGTCVACHVVSRSGQRLAAQVNHVLGEISVVSPYPPIIDWTAAPQIKIGWATFSPDDTMLVTATNGVLTRRNADTGAALETIDLGARFGTTPDWAPDGHQVAFTYSTQNKDRGVTAASVAVVPWDGSAFGPPQPIVPSSGATDDNYYPQHSPDSQWLAFVKSPRTMEKDPDAQLHLVTAAGGPPIPLARANTLVGTATVATGIANNMPTWAPSTDPTMQWVAFTSRRAYGFVLPAQQQLQIWVAAVDLAQAAAGADPSDPAFRLPFQDHCENNHLPYWVKDVTHPPPQPDGGLPDGPACVPSGGSCDVPPFACCEPAEYCLPGDGGYVCQADIG
ncbi:MAG: hypothetical protein HY906_13795 [Deltaproteobacteria bacterium]|nr:hypothetical protein [Deltaproteobacteria bacterium]